LVSWQLIQIQAQVDLSSEQSAGPFKCDLRHSG